MVKLGGSGVISRIEGSELEVAIGHHTQSGSGVGTVGKFGNSGEGFEGQFEAGERFGSGDLRFF